MPSHRPQAVQALQSAALASFGSAAPLRSSVRSKRSTARCIRLRQRFRARGVVFRVISSDAIARDATATLGAEAIIFAPYMINMSDLPTVTIVNGEYSPSFVKNALRPYAAHGHFRPVSGG